MDHVRIGHACVHSAVFSEILDMISEHAALTRAPAYVVTLNAQHIVLLESDLYLHEIYSNAALVVPDGASLLLPARLLGRKLKEQITGIDLFERLCGRAAQNQRQIMHGYKPDVDLQADDILYVPNSVAKSIVYRGLPSIVQSASNATVYASIS